MRTALVWLEQSPCAQLRIAINSSRTTLKMKCSLERLFGSAVLLLHSAHFASAHCTSNPLVIQGHPSNFSRPIPDFHREQHRIRMVAIRSVSPISPFNASFSNNDLQSNRSRLPRHRSCGRVPARLQRLARMNPVYIIASGTKQARSSTVSSSKTAAV